jgi:hypothetical protein
MTTPSDQLREVYWSLGAPAPQDLDAFAQAVADYQLRILGGRRESQWRPDAIVARTRLVTLSYMHWSFEDEEHVTSELVITREDAQHTAAQLLHALHQHSHPILSQLDQRFFEGLEPIPSRCSTGCTVFHVLIGS